MQTVGLKPIDFDEGNRLLREHLRSLFFDFFLVRQKLSRIGEIKGNKFRGILIKTQSHEQLPKSVPEKNVEKLLNDKEQFLMFRKIVTKKNIDPFFMRGQHRGLVVKKSAQPSFDFP